jgi:hypothetical protein
VGSGYRYTGVWRLHLAPNINQNQDSHIFGRLFTGLAMSVAVHPHTKYICSLNLNSD